MANQISIQSQNEMTWRAFVIMDAGHDELDGMSKGCLVEVGRAHCSADAMHLARTKFETLGVDAIGFTAERVARK